MKTFIRSVVLMAMLVPTVSSFAQKARPVVHHPVRHYKHHRKAYPAKSGLRLPPPPGKLPAPPSPGKLPAPPAPKLPALPHP